MLDDKSLERSGVVANSRMNRERGLDGVNSYANDLGMHPLRWLLERLEKRSSVAWLDICCGQGRALIEASRQLDPELQSRVSFHGVDLVDAFASDRSLPANLQLEVASLHDWRPPRAYDLITCVHGLHYVGDKLGLIARCVRWLVDDGAFLAHLDPANCRGIDGKPLGRALHSRLRRWGIAFDRRARLIACPYKLEIEVDLRYLGADDTAGANFTGQEAVNSYYEVPA